MPTLLSPNGQPLPPASLTKAAEEPACPGDAPEPIPCVTAFIIYQLPDGRWQAADDLDTPLVPGRKPVPDDIYAGASIVLKDALAAEAAITGANLILSNVGKAVVQEQMNMGRMMAEQQANARVQQQMAESQLKPGRR